MGKEHKFVVVIQKSKVVKKHVILGCEKGGKKYKQFKDKLVRNVGINGNSEGRLNKFFSKYLPNHYLDSIKSYLSL